MIYMYTHIHKHRARKSFDDKLISLQHIKQELSGCSHFYCTIKEGFTTYVVFFPSANL